MSLLPISFGNLKNLGLYDKRHENRLYMKKFNGLTTSADVSEFRSCNKDIPEEYFERWFDILDKIIDMRINFIES